MGLSMPAWISGDHAKVAEYLSQGITQLAKAGADFFVCPDNTAHIVLEAMADEFLIPGLHIAHVVCHEIVIKGWRRVGVLGTKWTMTGPVYANALEQHRLEKLVPAEEMRERLNAAIFDELCQGIFTPETIQLFQQAIEELKARGAECVVLGCTEIPLIINADNSALPALDSTRLLAQSSVCEAVSTSPLASQAGWLEVRDCATAETT